MWGGGSCTRPFSNIPYYSQVIATVYIIFKCACILPASLGNTGYQAPPYNILRVSSGIIPTGSIPGVFES